LEFVRYIASDDVQISATALISLVVISVSLGSLTTWLGLLFAGHKYRSREENINLKRADLQRIISRERVVSRGIFDGLRMRSGIGRGDTS
jgi:hypothetical protein